VQHGYYPGRREKREKKLDRPSIQIRLLTIVYSRLRSEREKRGEGKGRSKWPTRDLKGNKEKPSVRTPVQAKRGGKKKRGVLSPPSKIRQKMGEKQRRNNRWSSRALRLGGGGGRGGGGKKGAQPGRRIPMPTRRKGREKNKEIGG